MKHTILKIFLLVIGLLVLSGCALRPDKVYVTKYKVVKIEPPKELYKDNITVPKPPSKYEYVKADPITRERMLTKDIIDLLGTTKKYKIKLSVLNSWYNKMDKVTKSTRDK